MANPVDHLPAPSSLPGAASTPESSSVSKFLQRLQSLFEESSGLVELVHLKNAVQRGSEKFDASINRVAKCRETVALAQKAHDQAHKKHVSLLMRREEWKAEDAQAFVAITAEEVTARQALLSAQEALKQAENFSMQCQHAYMDMMRQRYHEEQLWQEKWRLLGTYGTWSLIGINTLAFVLGQFREMNRLHHMEQLLLQRYPGELDDQRTAAECQTPSVVKEEEGLGSASADKEEGTSERDMPGHPARMAVRLDDEFATVLYGVPLHAPSMALGAAVSACLIIVLSLFHRR
jgi:She9 / Mdm33 family